MSCNVKLIKKISLIAALAFFFLPQMGLSQNQWDIQFAQSSLLSANQVCYNLELKSSNSTSWTLGDQNYRLFFDGDLITVNSATSLLPTAFYGSAVIDQNFKLSGLGQEAASPLDDIDDNLGFLDFSIVQSNKNDPLNAVILEESNFVAIAEICLTIDPAVLNDPTGNTCLSIYHVNAENAGTITSQYTTISENDAPGSTDQTLPGIYDHLTSEDGAASCLGNTNVGSTSFLLKAKLQGAMIGAANDLMRDDLRVKGLIPLQEPYSELNHFQHVHNGGGETIDMSMLSTEGNDAVVDWIFIEIRDAMVSDSVIATKSAILQRDGDITDTSGNPVLIFSGINNGNYFIAVRHRNHLGVMSSNPISLDSANPQLIDFSDLSTETWGVDAQRQSPQFNEMWSGDLNGDRRAVYQGPNNDVANIFLLILTDSLNVQNNVNFRKEVYDPNDLDLDGIIIYQGPNNDRSKLVFSSILPHPLNTSFLVNFINLEQLPR